MEFSKASARNLLGVIIISLLAVWILFRTGSFLGAVGTVVAVITPFMIGGCIAFVMNEMLKITEKGWNRITKDSSKGRRPVCLFISFIAVLAAISVVILIIIPELKKTAMLFIESMPAYVDQLKIWNDEFFGFLNDKGLRIKENAIDFYNLKKKVTEVVMSGGGDFINATVSATSSVIGVVVNIFLALAFSVFILAGKEKLANQIKRLMKVTMPDEKYNKVMHVLTVANKSFSSYVTGQLLEAVIIGVLCFIGMSIFGIPYASAVSVLVGFTALIPMFGAFIGTAIGAVLILFVAPMKALWFIVFIIVLQQLEGNLIYPKVVGKSIGLPGIWVLAAVTIGGSTFGIVGILVGVPLFSTIYELTREFVRKREERLK